MSAQQPLRSPVCFYGGKGQIAHRIIDLLPPHEAYCEPCAGGLSVFFRKPPVALETINDLDSGVVGFYRVLRDPEQFARFERMASLTPYAREEYNLCRVTWRQETDPVRRAWAWFVMVRLAYGGGGRHAPTTGWKVETTARHARGDGSSFGYRVTNGQGSASTHWLSAIDALSRVHERLRNVQIEHCDVLRMLTVYGRPGVCMYIDPPYVLEQRTGGKRYECEMTLDDHHALTESLLISPAMCVLSGYRHESVHAPLEETGWERIDMDVALNVARHRIGARRTESVWRNPAAMAAWRAAMAQQPLFRDRDDGSSDDDDNLD